MLYRTRYRRYISKRLVQYYYVVRTVVPIVVHCTQLDIRPLDKFRSSVVRSFPPYYLYAMALLQSQTITPSRRHSAVTCCNAVILSFSVAYL